MIAYDVTATKDVYSKHMDSLLRLARSHRFLSSLPAHERACFTPTGGGLLRTGILLHTQCSDRAEGKAPAGACHASGRCCSLARRHHRELALQHWRPCPGVSIINFLIRTGVTQLNLSQNGPPYLGPSLAATAARCSATPPRYSRSRTLHDRTTPTAR